MALKLKIDLESVTALRSSSFIGDCLFDSQTPELISKKQVRKMFYTLDVLKLSVMMSPPPPPRDKQIASVEQSPRRSPGRLDH